MFQQTFQQALQFEVLGRRKGGSGGCIMRLLFQTINVSSAGTARPARLKGSPGWSDSSSLAAAHSSAVAELLWITVVGR